MKFEEQLDIYLRARFTLILLVTNEEQRALQVIKNVCDRTQRQCLTWDLADGFQWLSEISTTAPTARDPLTALDNIEHYDNSSNALFVLKDFHDAWSNPQVRRKLRSVSQKLRSTRRSMLVISYSSKIPDELKDEVFIVDFPLPDAEEIEDVFKHLSQSPNFKTNLTPLGREKIIQAALGLTSQQAQRVFSKAYVSAGVMDDRGIDQVTEQKKQIIRESEALEYYPVTEIPSNVGGLGILKEWLSLRERAFSQEARNYGLPPPKGIALIGIPGTGKSLTAKMIGGLWRMPLLRLDVGALFGSLVGESEERARRALQLAETVAPCIMWIDEIEKALAHGGLDSGTSTRVFASILTWMQEKTAPVFVVATANDISSIPPELLRKGRFDEIFFLDLPTLEERKEIFTIHLKKHRREVQDYNLDLLAARSEGYVGSEIEQAIIEAMYYGFNDNQREFTTEDISLALERTVPLSVAQRETVNALRSWLIEGRAQSASFSGVSEAEHEFVQIVRDTRPNKID
jgi:hypothetical protein